MEAMENDRASGLGLNAEELGQCVEDFKQRHETLSNEIDEDEAKRAQIESDIQILTKRLMALSEEISGKIEEKNAYARVIAESEAAYSKIFESSQTLLSVLKRESAAIQRRHI